MIRVDWKKWMLPLFAISTLSVIYLTQDINGSSESLLGSLSQPAQQLVYGASGEIVKTVEMYSNLISVKSENQHLKSENNRLLSSLNQMQEIQLENQRLKALVKFKESQQQKMVAAQVIGTDLNSGFRSLIINKGSSDNVKKLDAVISPEGVVGYVIEVTSSTAKVILASDRSASIDAIIQRTRARGIVSGLTSGNAILKYVDKKEDISKGDIVVTSGRQGFFPKGFPIGTVDKLNSNPFAVSTSAVVRPAVSFAKLEEVLVVAKQKPEVKP